MGLFLSSRPHNWNPETGINVAAWLQCADLNGSLESYFNPPPTPEEREGAARARHAFLKLVMGRAVETAV
jgi:hypothetical protein